MHDSVMAFVRQQVETHELAARMVLEVGSLNVNGSPRQFFTGDYLGVDMQPGPGVDLMLNAHQLSQLNGFFDVILCTEMLEHDDAPWVSLGQMCDVCEPGGFLLLTCRGYDARGCFPVHDHPDDLWRFSVHGVRALLGWTGWDPVDVREDPDAPGVLAVARRL